MRVIAGKLKGLQLASPKSPQTRPMSDRMRGALFNALGDIADLTVLDAFAGSGAIAIEAVSRGARSVVAVERDKKVARTLESNIARISGFAPIKAVQANISTWLKEADDSLRFDVIVADPPYDDTQLPRIEQLIDYVVLDGLLVLSWPADDNEAPVLDGAEQLKRDSYAGGSLIYYRRK